MRERCFGLNEFKTEKFERQSFEKRRSDGKRVNRRANVVYKSGQSQFRRTCAAADCFICFDNQNRQIVLRQQNRRRQTVRTRADDNRIVFVIFHFSFMGRNATVRKRVSILQRTRSLTVAFLPLIFRCVFEKMMTKFFPLALLHSEISRQIDGDVANRFQRSVGFVEFAFSFKPIT